LLRTITISFCEKNGKGVYDSYFNNKRNNPIHSPYIGAVGKDNDQLFFSQFIGKGLNPCYKIICERPILRIQGLKELLSPSCPRQNVDPKPRLPAYYIPIGRYKVPVYEATYSLIKTFCEQNNLIILDLSRILSTIFKCEKTSPLEFSARGAQTFSLKQGMDLAARCNKQLLSFSQTNQLYKDLIKKLYDHRSATSINPSPHPIPEQFVYRISFWDENVDRPVAPYIAEIRLFNGKLTYFTADENQQLVLAFEESFSESLAH
jgi:hypothetical protein